MELSSIKAHLVCYFCTPCQLSRQSTISHMPHCAPLSDEILLSSRVWRGGFKSEVFVLKQTKFLSTATYLWFLIVKFLHSLKYQSIEFLSLICCVTLYISLSLSEFSFYQLKFCQIILLLYTSRTYIKFSEFSRGKDVISQRWHKLSFIKIIIFIKHFIQTPTKWNYFQQKMSSSLYIFKAWNHL